MVDAPNMPVISMPVHEGASMPGTCGKSLRFIGERVVGCSFKGPKGLEEV